MIYELVQCNKFDDFIVLAFGAVQRSHMGHRLYKNAQPLNKTQQMSIIQHHQKTNTKEPINKVSSFH